MIDKKLPGERLLFLLGSEIFMKIFFCVLLVIAGVGAHYFLKRFVVTAFKKRASDNILNSKKINTLLAFLLSIIRYIVYFLIFYLFCKVLNVPIDSLFIAVAGASSVAFGLGAQTLMKNIINGFFILLEDQYSVGDYINVGDYTGTVEEIGIRTTKIKSIDGNIHIVPNGEINIITNMTQNKYPTYFDVNLPYEASAEKVLDVLKDEMEKIGEVDGLLEKPSVLGISSFGQYCYTVKICVKSEQSKYLGVERAVRLSIKKRLEHEKIPQPAFPQPFTVQ